MTKSAPKLCEKSDTICNHTLETDITQKNVLKQNLQTGNGHSSTETDGLQSYSPL